MCRPIAVGLVLAAILASARANISPEPEFGQSLSPRVPNGVAMTALEALRAVKPRGILPKPRVFQQWIDQLLAFAAGGPAPD